MMVVRSMQASVALVLLPSTVSTAVITTLLANISLDVIEFSSPKVADAMLPSSAKIFEETFQKMSTTKLFRVVGKLLSFCMTIGMAAVDAVKVRRTQRGISWLQRSRYGGPLERIRAIAKRVIAAAVILLILLIVVTTEWWRPR